MTDEPAAQSRVWATWPGRPTIRKKGREYQCDWGGFGLSTGSSRQAAYSLFLKSWIGKVWAEKLAAGGPQPEGGRDLAS